MSQIGRILKCIRPDELVSADMIMERTGFPRSICGPVLHVLVKKKRLVVLYRGIFALATSSMAFDQVSASLKAEAAARKKAGRQASLARYAQKLKERELPAIRQRPASAEAAASIAIAARHPLAMAWGDQA